MESSWWTFLVASGIQPRNRYTAKQLPSEAGAVTCYLVFGARTQHKARTGMRRVPKW